MNDRLIPNAILAIGMWAAIVLLAAAFLSAENRLARLEMRQAACHCDGEKP